MNRAKKMNKARQFRDWAFTLNNYSEKDMNELCTCLQAHARYYCFGKEVGNLGTPHLQGCIYFSKVKSLVWVKKNIHDTAHFEPRNPNSTFSNLVDYCKKGSQSHEEWNTFKTEGPNYGKDANVTEWGEPPSQGKRNDLQKDCMDILEGKKKLNEVLDDAYKCHLYARTYERFENERTKRNMRTTRTKGIWFYGRSNTGKSYWAHEMFGRSEFLKTNESYKWKDKVYIHNTKDKGWWDHYNQQEIVIIDDFRGSEYIPYDEILKLADEYPHTVLRRNKGPIEFNSKYIVITSSLHPEEIFKNRNKQDHIAQFWRRFDVYHFTKKDNKLPDIIYVPNDVLNIFKDDKDLLDRLQKEPGWDIDPRKLIDTYTSDAPIDYDVDDDEA